jgi:hypothetical protein
MSAQIKFVVLVGLVLLSGCASGQATPDPVQSLFSQLPKPPDGSPLAKGTYVGALDGSRILIGLVVQDNVAGVYICDGQEISEWFGGAVNGGKLDLTTANQTHLVATVGATITGQVTLADKRTLTFTAVPAVEGKTGLFRLVEKINDEEANVTGWIVTESAKVGRKVVAKFRGAKNLDNK